MIQRHYDVLIGKNRKRHGTVLGSLQSKKEHRGRKVFQEQHCCVMTASLKKYKNLMEETVNSREAPTGMVCTLFPPAKRSCKSSFYG